jgi:hypothetical protein
MTESPISIAAFVSEGERASVQLAAGHIGQALSQAADIPWTCGCVFTPELESLGQGNAAIIVTSFLPELKKTEEPWPQAEQRLRTAYATLGARGTPIFICTVLRHVGRDEEPESAAALRLQIRRLNLLAAEISRETGACVIDLDRVLADIGARRLQTDYRLRGNPAAEVAGHFIALTLINNALDALVPFEVQDAARAILTSRRPDIAGPDSSRPEILLGNDLLSMGQGRRKQTVLPVIDTDQENHVGWLIRQVLQGRVGAAEAVEKLIQAVRRRGLRESVLLLASGLSRHLTHKK